MKYPEIPLVKYRPEIFAVKEVVACEKLHGSNFSIIFPLAMKSIDEVIYGSREVLSTEDRFPLGVAKRWFESRPELLTAMWEVIKSYGFSEVTVFGEAYGPGIQAKGIKYTLGSEMLFRAFDIMVGPNFLTYDLFCEVATKMGLPQVPLVWRGAPTIEAFDALLNRPSYEALSNGVSDNHNLAEGVVIRSNPLLRNVFGDWLIVKHKGTKFSEVAFAPTPTKERTLTPADKVAATYVTEGRVLNAAGRLLDRGVALMNSMQDMPTILAEIIADLHKECAPDLVGIEEKSLRTAVSRVLGPIYKQVLETK